MKKLCNLKCGETAVVKRIEENSPLRRRLFDIGLVSGASVTCIQKSIFGDPAAYLIRDTVIAIRNDDAQSVFVS